MQKKGTQLLFSPSDLITFMSDLFSSWMDRRYLENPEGMAPDEADESAKLVQRRGIVHEIEFLDSLVASGKDVCTIEGRGEEALAATVAAMKAGREVIYQGYLAKEQFAGLSDFLIKCDGKSHLGDWHYEVWDSKLARKPKPYFLVQLCAYAEMLELIQGIMPVEVAIVLGSKEVKRFRSSDYIFFYRSLKERFLKFQSEFEYDVMPDWPNPGEYSRWKTDANRLLEERDDLLRVANIRKSQIKKLKAAGVPTLTALAKTDLKSVAGISQNAYETLRSQARLQLLSTGEEIPKFEIILQDDAQFESSVPLGLYALPPSSELDVFFDMEGYPYIEGGLEYLFGASSIKDGGYEFNDWWAHNRNEEKIAFENFIDWVYERWQRDPQLHIYHYGAYEVSAMRRLSSRHATRESELDEMLRAELFVDLYSIVKNGIRIGADSYSIKKVELLYMNKRQGDVSKATDSIVYYERWIEHKDGNSWSESQLLADIRDYNRIDCESTAQLFAWLGKQQRENGISYRHKANKSSSPIKKPATQNEELAERLRMSIPPNRSGDPERWRITELLADLLGFHNRESKVGWWEFFDRAELSEDELALDPECIAGVHRIPREPLRWKQSLLIDYSFDPEQDLKLQAGDTVVFTHDIDAKADIFSIDEDNGVVRLKLSEKKDAEQPLPASGNLILMENVRNAPLEDSIQRQAKRFLEDGVLSTCVKDLLTRSIPRIKGVNPGEPIAPDGQLLDAAMKMDNTYLCVQGPPGTGKTYQAAHSIIDLIRNGKKIAVCSNSHKAIENLLEEIGREAEKCSFQFKGAKVGQDKSGKASFSNNNIGVLDDKKALKELNELDIIGATAWFFAKPDLIDKFDYLFVDEAGQVCLANVLAMAPCSKNIVLIGDQLQLEQPVRGSHPGESGLSSLEYLLGDAATISPERGVFLSTTRRMHPKLCKSVSEAVYDGRLVADKITEERWLIMPADNKDSSIQKTNGIVYLPVEHQGNSQSSSEEVDRIESLINEMLNWQIHEEGSTRKLTMKDILIIAPYNRQVRLIKSRIENELIGSVDKFQGRQAAVVILSMTASDLASSARGMEFLLSKRRLNVGISRAKLLSIVIGSPSFAEFPCSTVEQAALLNFYCRLMQEGVNIKELETCGVAIS